MSTAKLPCPPQVVLFDLDGVLIDSFDVWAAVLEDCRAARGLPPLGIERIRASWGQGMDADVGEFFPGASIPALSSEYTAGFRRHMHRVRVIAGVPEAVAALRRAAVRLAVVTNSPADVAAAILEHAGLTRVFETVAGGDEVRISKPHPELLHLALHRLGACREQAVLVGDTVVDLAAARAAGIPAIGYRIDGDARIDDMAALPGLLGCAADGRS